MDTDDNLIRPLSRCAKCNGLVDAVAKADVENELLHGTRNHYESFHRCRECRAIYWRGAHAVALEAWIDRLTPDPSSVISDPSLSGRSDRPG